MATKYCDHGIYAAPVAGGTVPTAAEDGNGSAKTAATMATLVITFTGVPAADEAITIAGVTFTAKASGATGNQFNAATDAATCATNLKNAINASATNAVKPVGAIAATAPLRNVVNACVSGAVVTVYTRCCGSEWNSVTETSTLSNASITAQWSGGGDGAYGYLFNINTTIWPAAVAVAGYGVIANIVPYLSPAQSGDVVHIRAHGDYSLTLNTVHAITMAPMGTLTNPVIFIVDTGVEWPEDGINPKITFSSYGNGNATYLNLTSYGNTSAILKGTRYGEQSFNLEFKTYGVSASGFGSLWVTPLGQVTIESVGFLAPQDNPSYLSGCVQVGSRGYGTSSVGPKLVDCEFESGVQGGHNYFDYFKQGYNQYFFMSLHGCTYRLHRQIVPDRLGIFANAGNQNVWNFYGCRFIGFVTGSRITDANIGVGYFHYATFENCDFGGITNFGPIYLASGIKNLGNNCGIFVSGANGSNDFSWDVPGSGFTSWQKGKSQPTLNATLPDLTKWSIYCAASTQATFIGHSRPLTTPPISKITPAATSLPEGIRTVVFNLMLVSNLSAWTKKDVGVSCTYIDTSGSVRVQMSYDPFGSALEIGSGWSDTSWNTQTWLPKKITITTKYAVKEATEISVMFMLYNTSGDVSQGVIIDPEILIS